MKTWNSADLSTLIFQIESGGRPKGGASEDSGSIPSLGGENIRQRGGLALESVKKVPLAFFERMSKGVLQHQDVLINKDGANTGKVGIYENQFVRACINEHVFLLRSEPDRLNQKFLYYILLSDKGQQIIRGKISGSAQPGLKSDFIRNFPVKVPISTEEQAQIAEVLSTVDRAIEQTEVLIAKYQRIKNGLMHDLLTRGIDRHGQLRDSATHKFRLSQIGLIPEDWKICTLSELTESSFPICYGILQVGRSIEGGIPTLTIRDLGGDYRTGIHHTSQSIEKHYARSRVKPGDLLLSVKGTTGRVDVVPEGFKGNISRDIARIRLIKGTDPNFFKSYFQSPSGFRVLDLITVGTTRREISIRPLKEILVPSPPEEEQKIIANAINSQNSTLFLANRQRSKLQKLKTGLMQDLLTGKVSVEPLLEQQNEDR